MPLDASYSWGWGYGYLDPFWRIFQHGTRTRVVQLVEPQAEPLTLSQVKQQLRLDYTYEFPDGTTEDLLLQDLITVARQLAENETRRSLMPQTKQLIADAFPYPNGHFKLYYPPFQSATVTYRDEQGQWQDLLPTVYLVTEDLVPRVSLRYNQQWPQVYWEEQSVKITYQTGYRDAAAVPAAIKRWMLLKIGEMYEQREASTVMGKPSPVTFVDGLLDRYRVEGFFYDKG